MSLARPLTLAALAWFIAMTRARGEETTPTPSATPKPVERTRIVQFPSDQSLGTFYCQPYDAEDPWYFGYPGDPESEESASPSNPDGFVGEATGPVIVPADWILTLNMLNNGEAGREYSCLEKLAPDAIQAINFRACPHGDEDLRYIRGLTSLRCLELEMIDTVSDAGLDHLVELHDLRYLALDYTRITDAGLRRIGGMKALECLHLTGAKVTGKGLASLARCSNLRVLGFSEIPIGRGDLAPLASLDRLETLWVRCLESTPSQSLVDEDLLPLAGMKSLKELDLSGNVRIGAPGMKMIGGLSRLAVLRLSHVTGLAKDGGAAIAELDGLPSLRELRLDGTSLPPGSLKGLRGWPHLIELSLGSTDVGDADMTAIAGCAELKVLDLSGTQVGSGGLAHLERLTALEEIDLREARVADDAIDSLIKLKSLTILYLNAARLSASALLRLASHPKLEYLYLQDSHVSSQTVEGIKASKGPGFQIQVSTPPPVPASAIPPLS